MLRECVEIVKSMWTEPETTYDGRYYTTGPRPLRPEAGAAAASADLDRRRRSSSSRCGSSLGYADRSNFGGKPDEFAAKCELLKGHCNDVGRDYDEIRKTWSPEVFIRATEAEVKAAGSRSFWGEPVESWTAGNLVGTPEQVAERINELPRPRMHRHRAVVRGLPRHRDADAPRREGDAAIPAERRRSAQV